MEQTLEVRKAALRQMLRAQRRMLQPRADANALAAALNDVLVAAGLSAASLIAGFLPTHREPDVLAFLAGVCRSGGSVVMPRTLPRRGMEWIPWRPGAPLAEDRHGLQAPLGDPYAPGPAALAGILVPALAVDRAGHRLGQGGGYYDRALQHLPRWPDGPLRIGVVHPEGVLDDPLPHAPHDEPLDAVASAGGWFRVGSNAAL